MNAQAQVDPSDMPILRTGIDFTLTQLLEKGFLHAVRDDVLFRSVHEIQTPVPLDLSFLRDLRVAFRPLVE